MDSASFRLTVLGLLLACAASDPTAKKETIDIYSFHINSTVTSRYAINVITSRVANRLNESQEVDFQVKIPKNAFISKFRMTIEGKTYDGVVKLKEEAQKQYTQAVSQGQSAGLISSVGRTLEEFKTSVTVGALSKVTFELTYEELLKRRLGKYELLIYARPTQPVADFKIDVHIHESPGISYLEVKGGLSTNELTSAVTTTRTGREVWVNFYPTRDQQTKCKGCGEDGLNGDLLITYDVERPKTKGELMTSNGYFVHYFAPTNVQRIPKNVVFLIDRSGSMHGKKIEQTRLALLRILGDLAEDDHFGLITFDGSVNSWRPELLKATASNLEAAKEFVMGITDRGSTDINAAVLKGVEMIKRHPREGSASILILLTDGDPTTGETNTGRIHANVKEAIGKKFPLYCLGFGFDVNFEFLEKMALENEGAARRIYEDSDADLQLQGFYEEVATPLLTDVQLNYTGVANLTQTRFSQYYNGSEIVVAGQLTDNDVETFTTKVIALSKSKKVEYHDSVRTDELGRMLTGSEGFIQRLWAHLTVKQLLEKELLLKGEEKEALRKQTLDLSLKYQFVTPLTSMVVTKPQGEDTQVAHKPKEGEKMPSSITPRGSAPRLQTTSAARTPRLQTTSAARKRRPFNRKSSRIVGYPDALAPSYAEPLNTPAQSETTLQLESTDSDQYPSVISEQSRYLVRSEPVLPRQSTLMTKVPTAPAPPAPVRFIQPARGQSLPLCYNIPRNHKLKLLHDPSSEFSMNGELASSPENGFWKIIIRYKTDHHITFSSSEIDYSDSQETTKFLWTQEPTIYEKNSVSMILRDKEMDVTLGNIRVVILLHEKNGDIFLWPAVRQRPSGGSFTGVMGKRLVSYEEVPDKDTYKVKIEDQEVQPTRSTAVDYSIRSTPSVGCWLVPLENAIQGNLDDLIVSQL